MSTKIKDLQQTNSFKASDVLVLGTSTGVKKMPMSVLVPNTPAAHNNLIRGKVLTDEYTLGEIFTMAQARDYHDIFAGDKIKVTVPAIAETGFAGGVTEFLVGEIESHHSYGDSTPLANRGHLLLVPAGTLGNAKMDDTNTTEGGYAGSKMHTTVIPAVVAALEAAFGADHVLTTRERLTNTVNTTLASKAAMGLMGCSTAGSWADCKARLMTELEVYGDDVWSSSAFDSLSGLAKQIAVFRMDREALSIRASWWLSAVVDSAAFAFVLGYGYASHSYASNSLGVRPRFAIG